MASEMFQCAVAACLKTRLPIIESAPPDMRGATGLRDILSRFPRLKQELTLGCRRARKVNVLGGHGHSIHVFI